MEQAIGAAQQRDRPLLVYWGAVWCPYCQALKKTVFTRADFIEKSKLFIPVYLDGDLPGAQAWGQKLRVTGYPTVLILRPDQTEISRLSGGMDLSLYALLIDDAIGLVISRTSTIRTDIVDSPRGAFCTLLSHSLQSSRVRGASPGTLYDVRPVCCSRQGARPWPTRPIIAGVDPTIPAPTRAPASAICGGRSTSSVRSSARRTSAFELIPSAHILFTMLHEAD